MNSTNTAPCVSCGYDIPRGVALCSECGSYQNDWLNWLKYVAGIVGVITVAAGAIAFVAQSLPEIRRMFWWVDKVEVLEFEEFGTVALINAGDGDVLVSHLFLKAFNDTGTGFLTSTYTVNAVVKPQMIFSEKDNSEKRNLIFGENKAAKQVVVNNVDDIQWSILLRLAARGGPEQCVTMAFVHPQSRFILQTREALKDSLRTFDAYGELHYFSAKSGKRIATEVPMKGVLFRSTDEKCRFAWSKPVPVDKTRTPEATPNPEIDVK